MQFWLVAGFIGPLGGFLLGIVITFLIFKRFASVRNFFFESLGSASHIESAPLLPSNIITSSSLAPSPARLTRDVENVPESLRPTILYYANSPLPPSEEQAPAEKPVHRPISVSGQSCQSRAMLSSDPEMVAPIPIPSTPPMQQQTPISQPAVSSSGNVLAQLFPLAAKGIESMLQERLPVALKSLGRPHWLEDVQMLSTFRLLSLEPPLIESCQVERTQNAVLIDTVWRPRLDARVRVKRTANQGGSFDVTIVSMELRASMRLALGSQQLPDALNLSQPVGLDFFLTAHCSPGMAQFSGQEPELLSMFKPWLIQAIQSGILGGMNHVDLNAHTQMFPPLVPRAISPARPSMAEHQQAPTSTPPPVEDQEPANGVRPISSSPSVTEPSPMMPMESPMSPAPKPEQLGKSMSRLNTISTRSAEPSATLDLDAVRRLATMKPEVWEGIHLPGKAAPFNVRGKNYLKDRIKIPAGLSAFTLSAFDMVALPHNVEHVSRFLPSVRKSGAPFAIVINLVIPGTPLLNLVATFVTDRDCFALAASKPPEDPMGGNHDWTPFDFVLHRFMTGDVTTRNKMLKLIPHIDSGNWVVRQAVGTKPVITGKALKTTYHTTRQYMEIDIDVSANSTAAYITGMVRGATSGLVIDLGFVLEGQLPWELPEVLIGAARVSHLDVKDAEMLDISTEIPLVRPAPK